ncbi:MAG: biotin transporter BioY [Gemmatimonadetes bacterium]|nr:biotin transporter BioY [Gemmatimonadota bacterium]
MLPASLSVRAPAVRTPASRLALAAAGALVVTLAAQVAVPLPGTPVPMTLQPLAVLVVGGLLGPRLGALGMVLYLAMGAAGLPVFTPFGAPGAARLFGPTGGYLLAFPVAAALVGRMTAGAPGWTALLAAPLLGMVAIHLGGAAQLLVLTGGAGRALGAGVLPFVAGDLVKVMLAALALRRALPLTRALR